MQCHRHGRKCTSSQQGHAVTSWRWYFGPQPLAKLILTLYISTGPVWAPFMYVGHRNASASALQRIDNKKSKCYHFCSINFWHCVCMCRTYLLWSKALRQCPGGTRYTSNDLLSTSQSVGECTKTGADERLYNQTPSDSLLNVTPKPIFCRAFSTASGVADRRCIANVDRHRPSPRGCSAKIFTAEFSTGNKRPTRWDSSQ